MTVGNGLQFVHFCKLSFFMKLNLPIIMKTLSVILSLFLLSATIPDKDSNISIGELEKINNSNLTRSALYTNLQLWASANDPACKKKIELADNDNCIIVLKFETNNFKTDSSYTKYLSFKYRFSLKVDCKENKYRWTITNPSVLIGTDDNIQIDYMTTKQLIAYRDEMETVEKISTADFNSILDWELAKVPDLLSANNAMIENLNLQIEKAGDSKSNNKAKRGFGYQIERINNQNAVYFDAIQKWNSVKTAIITNLEKSMSVDSNF
jgi:Domain of unknown function (DUF4468) with TBP-like fold